jgi:glycerol-3-phosphate acyltransferase PlsY
LESKDKLLLFCLGVILLFNFKGSIAIATTLLILRAATKHSEAVDVLVVILMALFLHWAYTHNRPLTGEIDLLTAALIIAVPQIIYSCIIRIKYWHALNNQKRGEDTNA